MYSFFNKHLLSTYPMPNTMLGTEDPRIEHAHRPEGATYIQITVIVTYVPNKDKFKAL